MIKLLLTLLLFMSLSMCHQVEHTQIKTHEHQPTSLYDKIIIEIKEAHHFRTVILSSLMATSICLLYFRLYGMPKITCSCSTKPQDFVINLIPHTS